MTGQTSVLFYFLHAGIVVKTVMMILLVASIASWTLILQRAWYFSSKVASAKSFLKTFWESSDLTQLYTQLSQDKSEKKGLTAIFLSGFKAFARNNKQQTLPLNAIERVMQIQQGKEEQSMEKHLSFLASVGSISPYIGLFGTVWGIMTSFQALGHAKQATIAMVAPGISEALVATALGLFTAIPAVLAYNRYTTKSNELIQTYDLFQEEFISLIEQQSETPSEATA